jgi:phosphatidylglycerol---prolipoprotein diacylglyceryl transferase
MSGIVIDIDPIALRLGHFELGWYSILVMLAFVVGTLVFLRTGRQKGIRPDQVYTLVMWLAVGGVLGARLFHVLDHLDHYLQNPAEILGFQGLAIWGGLAGGGLAAVLYARAARIPVRKLADAGAPAVLAGQIMGRFACIVNGDAYGGATSLPWGFIYINPGAMIPEYLKGIPTHPYPVYEMLWNGLILLLLFKLASRLKVDGALFLVYVSMYAVGRGLLTLVRQENVLFLGLQEAQLVALMVLLTAAPMLWLLLKGQRKRAPAGVLTPAP